MITNLLHSHLVKTEPLPRVITTAYEFAHGKKPRGTGTWAFGLRRNTPADMISWHSGTYAQAKRKAQEVFRGCGEIFVQS